MAQIDLIIEDGKLQEVLEVLGRAAKTDIPEGTNFIQISATLLLKILKGEFNGSS